MRNYPQLRQIKPWPSLIQRCSYRVGSNGVPLCLINRAELHCSHCHNGHWKIVVLIRTGQKDGIKVDKKIVRDEEREREKRKNKGAC